MCYADVIAHREAMVRIQAREALLAYTVASVASPWADSDIAKATLYNWREQAEYAKRPAKRPKSKTEMASILGGMGLGFRDG